MSYEDLVAKRLEREAKEQDKAKPKGKRFLRLPKSNMCVPVIIVFTCGDDGDGIIECATPEFCHSQEPLAPPGGRERVMWDTACDQSAPLFHFPFCTR